MGRSAADKSKNSKNKDPGAKTLVKAPLPVYSGDNLSPLDPDFYLKPTKHVARDLLGKILRRTFDDGHHEDFRIVETEAYLGLTDPSCHSFGDRRTPRTSTMYLRGGHVYVYFIYGMYFCLNIVTREEGVPEAVLIRALEPLTEPYRRTNGPGILCKSLEIDRSANGLSLLEKNSPLQLFEDPNCRLKKSDIQATPRIGINSHKEARTWDLRFHLKDHPHISKGRFYAAEK